MRLRLWTARVALAGLVAATAGGLLVVLDSAHPVLAAVLAVLLLACQVRYAAHLIADAADGCPSVQELLVTLVPALLGAYLAVRAGDVWQLGVVVGCALVWFVAVHRLAALAAAERGGADE